MDIQALAKELRRWRRRVFRLGDTDCVAFANDCLMAQGGPDLLEPYRGRYETMEEAALLVRSSGYDGLAELMDECLLLLPGHEIGAIAYLRLGIGGVCLGVGLKHHAVFVGTTDSGSGQSPGLVMFPLSAIHKWYGLKQEDRTSAR